MAISEQGYLRPTYEELLEDRIALAEELFGQDIDTSDASALGKFIRLSVKDLAQAYEDQEIIYYSRFPHTATGQSLDRLMPFASISRNPPTRAEHVIKFKGLADYVLRPGFLVGTTGDEKFYLINSVKLVSNGFDENNEAYGYGEGIVQCTEYGEIGNVALGAICEVVNPDVFIEAIEHVKVLTIGKETETDAELRDRFDLAIVGSGSGTAASIRGAVMRVSGVTGCRVVENNTNAEDSEGRPPHSFEVYVYAPDTLDKLIAEAIFSKKPVGIQTHGDLSEEVTDVSGNLQTVKFSRVSETVLYVKLTVAVDSDFELEGEKQIKEALEKYINKLSTGEDVVFTSLYRHIFGVAGIRDVTSLGISTDGKTYNAQNVVMDNGRVARISAANIEVEVTAYADR